MLKSYEYDAFGEEVSPTATDANPFRYAGQYFDAVKIGLGVVGDAVVQLGYQQVVGGYNKNSSKSNSVLESAKFSQRTYSLRFSKEGQEKYSNLVGYSINTIDDLANAIKKGHISVDDIPISYIVRDGKALILNTRSSQALMKAGIPRTQWNAVNMTGDSFFENELTKRLMRNRLTSDDIDTVIPKN